MKDILRIAVQKKGRLSEKSMRLLKQCGISVANGSSTKLKTTATNFPMEVLFLRDDDIPEYVSEGVVDAGILGENVVLEKARDVETSAHLGFARCRLSLAIRRGEQYSGAEWFNRKRIATSYPNILREFLIEHNIQSEIEVISGSVEIAPGIGLADGICDIVSTGSTLLANGLEEVEVVMRSEAILITTPELIPTKQEILDRLLFRLKAVQSAAQNKYILLNAPNSAIPLITSIIPGMKSPSILPLSDTGWSSIHSVVKEDDFWQVVDQLKAAGAQGILVCPIEKMVV